MGRRGAVLFGALAGALLFVAPVVAAAQRGPVPYLAVEPRGGEPGTVVKVRGGSFNTPHDADDVRSTAPVVVRFGGLAGPVVWTGPPDAGGFIAFDFTVPEAPVGARSLVASQHNDPGAAVAESSASANFTVGALVESPASPPADATGSPATTDPPAPIRRRVTTTPGLSDEVVAGPATAPDPAGGGSGPSPAVVSLAVAAGIVLMGGGVRRFGGRRRAGPPAVLE